MIKVFLSHQRNDAGLAAQIARRLTVQHNIDSYLDVIDPFIDSPGEDLAAHIRAELGKCNQLLAVISETTRSSQWVPWEIGVATEKSFPLATYSSAHSLPPEFLRKWPYLQSEGDLDEYAHASKLADRTFIQKRAMLSEGTARLRSTDEFFRTLRARLGQ